MPFNKNRNSRDDKSGKDFKKSDRSESTNRSKSENRPFNSSSDYKKKDDSSFNTERKPYGEKSASGERKAPYGSREGSSGGSYRDKKPYGTRSEGSYGDKKPYGTRSEGSNDRKPYGDRKENFGDKKPFGSREGSYGDRKPFGEKREGSNDRKPYGDRKESSFGDRKPFGEKREGSNDRKPFGDRKESSFGDRKPFGDRKESSFGDRKPFGDKRESSFGDRKPFGDKREGSFGDRKPFGEREGGDRKPYQKKDTSFEGRKAYGEKRNFNKTDSERKPFVSSDKSFGGEKTPYANRENYNNSDENSFKRRSDDLRRDSNQFNDDQVKLKSRSNNKSFRNEDDTIRLNRFISNAGICSRRKADELIAAGVVSVNGEAVTELGTKVNPAIDQVRYNGELLKRGKMVYVLLNKPKDYITTTDDPQERKTVMDLVDKATSDRIYPVGRLDRNTTGLLLLTNDGDLADKLSHPKNSISKIYNVELDKALSQGDFNKIAFGLELEDGFIKPDDVRYVTGGSKSEVGIQIHSGKNRIVRRIFESLGYDVIKLDRVIYANLTKKDLTRGRWRYLTEQEIIQLKHFTKG
ncbi:pseudouridylate synthase [Pedobacter psychrophilus]|uniref:Pseudouridine synthase n=1 Tax=Pedobacter psychrophilus TaxID=1826909 RepID=A0A179DHU0_9SPHI|nr:pseudouridine synthase [Pedobacter psychrophilus]OAQ40615.1 pseudouridylate synthase [Pedobacter psychrophilus]